MTVFPDITSRQPDLEAIAQAAITDGSYREQLFTMLLPRSKRAQARYNSYRALMLVSSTNPELLMTEWDQLVEMLSESNKDIIFIAVHLIANLTAAGSQGRFEVIFDRFFDLLGDQSVVVAMHTAGVSGKIANAQPFLRERITRRLLEIEQLYPEQANIELVKAYVIAALDEVIDASTEKEEILEFVSRQTNSTSPKTRKAAREFLKTHAPG